MFTEFSTELILGMIGAFALGWIVATIIAHLKAEKLAQKQDPRDLRIRELEARLRIAESKSEDSKSDLEKIQGELKETTVDLEKRNHVITKQQSKLDQVSTDLKDSVLKTRELRSELLSRAEENIHAEAKVREVETELSVAQASNDMIATGVLDYSLAPKGQRRAGDIPTDDIGLGELSLEDDDSAEESGKTSG